MPKYKQAVVFSKIKKFDDKDKAVDFYMHDKEAGAYLDDLGYRPNPTALSLTTKYMFKGRSQTGNSRISSMSQEISL